MGYPTILVHCDASRTTPGRIGIAFDLAGRFDSHVVGLHVRQRFEAPMFTDGSAAMDRLYKSYEEAVKADEAVALAAFKRVSAGAHTSSAWRAIDGYAEEGLAAEARYADLVVVGQHDPQSEPMATPADLVERLALKSERPLLVVPHIGASKPPGKTVMLCWSGSREASRAATGALPLLKRASSVVVLIVDPRSGAKPTRGEPDADIVQWLSRHGAKVAIQHDSAADSDVGNVILSRAADLDVDLIVMGVYGHSRMREMVLGGASRTLLHSMTVPLLIAH
jgi:nucleotide-binding universal stress UspA family protein